MGKIDIEFSRFRSPNLTPEQFQAQMQDVIRWIIVGSEDHDHLRVTIKIEEAKPRETGAADQPQYTYEQRPSIFDPQRMVYAILGSNGMSAAEANDPYTAGQLVDLLNKGLEVVRKAAEPRETGEG